MIYFELFWAFCLVGAFAVGGGYAAVPLIEHQVIELHNWITLKEFLDIFAISQTTPGPIGINAATFIGTRVAGVGGAVAATLGFVTPSFIIMIILAKILEKYGSIGAIRGILNGLKPAVVSLIGAAGLMFVTLVLWNRQHFPVDIAGIDYIALLIIALGIIAYKKKIIGVIQIILGAGVLNLVIQVALR